MNTAKTAKPAPKQRTVFNAQVRQQFAPFYEVHVAGHSVEFTHIRAEAHRALRDGMTGPRVLTMVDALGRRHFLEQVL